MVRANEAMWTWSAAPCEAPCARWATPLLPPAVQLNNACFFNLSSLAGSLWNDHLQPLGAPGPAPLPKVRMQMCCRRMPILPQCVQACRRCRPGKPIVFPDRLQLCHLFHVPNSPPLKFICSCPGRRSSPPKRCNRALPFMAAAPDCAVLQPSCWRGSRSRWSPWGAA